MLLVHSQLPLPTYLCPPSCLHLLSHVCLTGRLCLVQLEMDGAFSSQFPLTLLAHSRLHAYRPLTTHVCSRHLLCLGRRFLTTFPGYTCTLQNTCFGRPAFLFQLFLPVRNKPKHCAYCLPHTYPWCTVTSASLQLWPCMGCRIQCHHGFAVAPTGH